MGNKGVVSKVFLLNTSTNMQLPLGCNQPKPVTMTWYLVELMGNRGRSAASHSAVFSYLVTSNDYPIICYNASYFYWINKYLVMRGL